MAAAVVVIVLVEWIVCVCVSGVVCLCVWATMRLQASEIYFFSLFARSRDHPANEGLWVYFLFLHTRRSIAQKLKDCTLRKNEDALLLLLH